MNKTASEAAVFVREFQRNCPSTANIEIGVAPPFTALQTVRDALGADSPVRLGAQDLYWEDAGAYTGEVSASMLKDLGCQFVIVGHSERRRLFGELDEWTNKKVGAALRHQLQPILCVGETLDERDGGLTERVVVRQLCHGLSGLEKQQAGRIVLAYEPVWAIGTGRAATPDQATAVHRLIRQTVKEHWSADIADALVILYGGSVTPQNITSFLSSDDIDGALVGGACLDPVSFATLAKLSSEACATRG